MITTQELNAFVRGTKSGEIKPEDYPGKKNEAFRLLIRSVR